MQLSSCLVLSDDNVSPPDPIRGKKQRVNAQCQLTERGTERGGGREGGGRKGEEGEERGRKGERKGEVEEEE